MAQQATVLTTVSIDVSPDGIKFTLSGLDTDLASLIEKAGDFVVEPKEFNNFETSNIVIKSKKVIQFVEPPTT